jgi:hypothetical protein
MERLPFKDMIYRMKTSLNLNTQCRTFSFGLLVLRFSEQLSMPIAKLAESYRALFTSIRACITLGLSVRSDAYTTNYLGIRASRTSLSFVLVSCLVFILHLLDGDQVHYLASRTACTMC